ncbi:hypothetical protein Tsubulata_029219 [Turnera subulata]|uniref:Uncharacterized protein n=1 Tax=Turnera subulata TaxID=218843 RepID=A0A9Q0J7I9_9ROSI|nr:hypothetical protein Tsubulata_029219 [Turnera subulata]
MPIFARISGSRGPRGRVAKERSARNRFRRASSSALTGADEVSGICFLSEEVVFAEEAEEGMPPLRGNEEETGVEIIRISEGNRGWN